MSIPLATRRFVDGELGAVPFLRTLLSHDPWYVAGAVVDPQGRRWLRVFSDLELAGVLDAVPSTSAEWVAQLDGPLHGVVVDGGLRLQRPQFDALRQWVRCLAVEATLRGEAGAGWETLRDYGGWRAAGRPTDAGFQLALAPDTRGRRLAAVFTAPDAADAFVERAGPGVEVVIQSAGALFGAIAELGVDGIVFNCAGPTPPIAVAAGFAESVLDAVDPWVGPLPCRTLREAHLFLDLLGLPRDGREHRVDGDVVWFTANEATYAFRMPDDPTAPGVGAGPSRILCAGALLLFAEQLAGTVPVVPPPRGTPPFHAASAAIGRGLECIAQVAALLDGDTVPFAACRTTHGRRLRRLEPRRFDRARIEAIEAAYRAVGDRYRS